MSDAPERRRRNRKAVFPNHMSLYESDEGLSLIAQLAAARGLTNAAYIRQLVREDAARQGVKPQAPEEEA
jgi:hypothetical protein